MHDPPLHGRLALFVAAAFGVSWAPWFLSPLLSANPAAALAIDELATFGPAVAALLVAQDHRANIRPSRTLAIGAASVTLLLTALLLAPQWTDAGSPLAICLLAVLTVTPAALVWGAASRSTRLRGLLGSILAPRSPWWTYAVALLLIPAASLLGTGLIALVGGDLGAPPQAIAESSWTGVPFVFALTLLFGGPLGEEIGWRGWLLPSLQRRVSPLLASLFVGLIWGCWHLPLHLRGVYEADMGSGVAGVGLRIASSCLLAVLFTWLYNRARGGLIVVILLHTSVNNTSGYWLPVNPGLTIVLLLVAVVVVLTDRMYARPGVTSESPAESGQDHLTAGPSALDARPHTELCGFTERHPVVRTPNRRGAVGINEETVVEEMSVDDCWKLLSRARLGRLAVAVGGEIDIFPVNFVVSDGSLMFRTAPGSKLLELSVNPRVAFEADEYDDTFAASVVVKGDAERVETQSDIDAADALPLTPWIPTLKYRWVRISPRSVTGRRFPRAPEPDRYSIIDE